MAMLICSVVEIFWPKAVLATLLQVMSQSSFCRIAPSGLLGGLILHVGSYYFAIEARIKLVIQYVPHIGRSSRTVIRSISMVATASFASVS